MTATTHVNHHRPRWVTIAIVVMVVLGLLFLAFDITRDGGKLGRANAKTVKVDATSTQKPENCVELYNVVLDPNSGNKVASNAAQEIDVTKPAEALMKIMAYAQHDPRTLKLYWNTSPLKKNPIGDWRTLVENGCYSADARNKYQQLVGAYSAASVKTSEAPATGINTGVMAGGDPFAEAPGHISGNRTAVQITFSNGDVIWVMKRCGNVVTNVPIPNVPPPPATPAKCAVEHFDPNLGASFCGSPTSGPEQQHPQEHHQPHTPGYVPGNAEKVDLAQQPVGKDPSKPTNYGTETGNDGHDSLPNIPSPGPAGPEASPGHGFDPGTGDGTEGTEHTSPTGSDPGGFCPPNVSSC